MTTLTEVRDPELRERPAGEKDTRKSPPPAFVAPVLFADVLLEVDSAESRRRKLSAVTSVVLQCFLLAFGLILPLMFTEALPKQQLLTFLVVPPPPPPPPAAAAAPITQVVRHIETDLMDGRLRSPSRIPQKVQMIREEEAPPPLTGGGVVGGVPGGIPGGQLGGVIGGIVNSTANLASVPKLMPVAPKRIRVSQGVIAGMVIHKVEPVYPVLARQARIQGEVVLSAIVSRQGTIQNLEVVSGHPFLIPAAVAAVQQWRYRPFLVSGEPVEVETRITVTFRFAN